jgi:hypothetical protein
MGALTRLKTRFSSTLWSTWLLTTLGVLMLSLVLAWASAGERFFKSWGSFLITLLLGLGILLVGWYAIRADKSLSLPRWLGWLVIGAAVLRLAAGVIWFRVLPVWGYGSPVEQAGYIMADAQARDMAAWELAKSDVPLWTAFRGYLHVDQYGGLLYLSALGYRYLGGDFHYPLQVIVLTAAASALTVLFTWAFVQRAWGEAPARVAAWLVALFPEAVLLGSSQMREAFTMPLVAAALYGLVRYRQDRSWQGLGWVLIALILCVPFSPAFAAVLLTMLTVIALAMDGWHAFRQPRLWLLLAGLAVVCGIGIWLAWGRIAPDGVSNPIALVGWWIKESTRWQAYFAKRASELVKKIFLTTPEWSHVLILMGIGVLQPFLPAALMDNAAPIWRGIAIWRALGWTVLLPFLLAAPFLAWGKNGKRGLDQGLSLVVWLGILLASLRSGGDTWDNPRYRVAFIGLQAALVAWVGLEGRRQASPWLGRAIVSFGLMLAWFLPWYLQRYTTFIWPVTDLFKTIGLGVASVGLYLLWSVTRNPRKRNRSSKDQE